MQSYLGKRAVRPVAALAALTFAALAIGCPSAAETATKAKEPAEKAAVASKAGKWRKAKNTALIVMDMQEGYMPVIAANTVVPAIEGLVKAADEAGAFVVWVYTEDGEIKPGSRLFSLAKPFVEGEGHLSVVKKSSSAFLGTDLQAMLDERGIGRVVVCGLASNGCVNATVEDAAGKGYYVVIPSDAHTIPAGAADLDDIAAMNATWHSSGYADVIPSAKVSYGAPALEGLGPETWASSPDFAAFLETSFKKVLARSPEWATQAGVQAWAGTDDASLDPLDPAGMAQSDAIERTELAALDAYDESTMTEGDKLAAAAYRAALTDSIALRALADFEAPANPTVFGVAYQMRSLFTDIQVVTDEASASAYIARLRKVPARIDQAIAQLERGEKKGAIAPRIVLESSLGAIREVSTASVKATPFYVALAEKLAATSVDQKRREAILSEAEKTIKDSVIPSYKRFEAKVRELATKAPDALGLSRFPGGAEYYAALLRFRTTTAMTPDEIHELGLKELERVHAEIVATAKKAGWGDMSAQAAVGKAFSSGNLDASETLAFYRERLASLETTLPRYFPVYPSSPVTVEVAPLGGYYQPGPIDGSKPGTFYVAQGRGADRAGMPTLLHHETIPGHHLQISVMQELDMPMVRRLVSFTAYVEGWALYAERLMAELGAYADDPVGDIGRLQAEAWRAARLVVDTGIHAKGWDFDRSVDFLVNRGLLDTGTARFEVTRYASIPAQATSYYVGFLKFMSLRDEAKAALGDSFDMGAYHKTVLACGALPLDALETVVRRWIDAAKREL
jgi:uncharacterized protein (DUF885 family)/nicotinamidase-related amidase